MRIRARLLGKPGEVRHNGAVTNKVQVSVIATVLNEEEAIDRLLRSLAAQARPPDEVVICDGGSRDGTVARIHALAAELCPTIAQVRVLVEPGANISRGRNVAIAAAQGPIIAVTDAGVRLDAQWLAELSAPWEQAGEGPRAVAGFFLPDVAGQSPFVTALAATTLPLQADIDPARFLPSSRSVAFTKAAWTVAGGYPEWLDYCEDLLFDFAINRQAPAGQPGFAWAPRALVYFRPRSTLSAFWTQYYRYARGDGKADLWRKRHALRYGVYLVLLPALVGHGLWGFGAKWLGWVGLLLGGAAYCWRPWLRLRALGAGLTPWEWLRAALWVPVARAVGDVAKMAGYPVGLRWRRERLRRGDARWRGEESAP